MSWILIDEHRAAQSWDSWASGLEYTSPFQSFAVGQYNKRIGSTPYYCAYFAQDGSVKALALCIVKARFASAGIFACVGGPAGDPNLWAGLTEVLARGTGLKQIYLRFRCDTATDERTIETLEHTGWRRVPYASGSNMTMVLDISKSMDEIYAGVARAWRQNLKNAQKNQLILEVNAKPDLQEITRIFSALVATKQFASTIDDTKLRSLIEGVGSNIVLFSAKDTVGELVSFRIAFVLGNQAVDFIAAATPAGRKLLATYSLYWHEIETLKAMGVTDFDLGGIDHIENPGVSRFKVQTGGEERTLLGEFEIANSVLLREALNLAVRARDLKFRLVKRINSWRTKTSAPAEQPR